MTIKIVPAMQKHPKPDPDHAPLSGQENNPSRRARVQSGMHATTRTRVVRKPLAAH